MASEKPENSVKSSSKILGLIPPICATLAAVSAGVLFAGLYDIGQFGLQKLVSDFAEILVAIFIVCAIPAILLSRRSSEPAQTDNETLLAKFDELRTSTTSRLMSFQSAIDAMSGQDRESLIEENRMLKEQLDAVQNAERQKVVDEVEQLRSQNAILEEKIKKWAIQTVDATIEDKQAEELNAALQ